MLTGVILAGGHSRRMGRDKAVIPVAGEPLWQRQARTLRAAGATRVALVLRPGQSVPPDTDRLAVQVLRDDRVDSGPIAGLHSALASQPPSAWYLVLAVDLPHLRPDWFGWLSVFCDDGIGAIARHDSGFEPLAAIYPAAAGPIVAAHIESGENSLQSLADHLVRTGKLRAVPLPARKRTQLANWNTPADIDLARTFHSENGSVSQPVFGDATPSSRFLEAHATRASRLHAFLQLSGRDRSSVECCTCTCRLNMRLVRHHRSAY
jgi:molybdopterin-guanine dinucleotide biosynthesis protein A